MVSRPRLVISHADAARLEEIWKNHSTSILGMLRTFCSSPEDAQDALQELFLRIGKNPAVVESAKSQRAFLIVAARRIAIDIARKRSSEQARLESPESVEALHPAQESKKNDPELEAAISAVVQKLPPEQRAVFIAKIIQGKTLAVIAAEQNITLNTAASRLRYSLDKIRNQLRPHYEAMKNQTNKPNTLTDSPERLIKPLEPKRVPSVIPGLEGVAAMTADDFENICILPLPEVLDLEETSSSGDIETAGCDPQGGGNAWENFRAPDTVELPLDSTEYSSEPESVIEDNTAEESVDGENLPTEEPLEIATTVEIPEVIICEPFDLSEQPVDEILIGIFEGETPIDPGSEDLVGEDGSLFSCWNYLSAFDGELQVIDDSSGDNGDESGTDDWSDWDLGEYYNDLLKEYDAFLAENPDWITENSGGDMHAQVVTPSNYTGLELADPGAARAFDLWFVKTYTHLSWEQPTDPLPNEDFDYEITPKPFDQWYHATYIAPYSSTEVRPVEGGSLNLSGDNHSFGSEISFTTSDGTGIPQGWLREGIIKLKGDGLIAETGTTFPPETLILGSITDSGIVVGEVRDEQEASEATPMEAESGTLVSKDVILEEIGDVPVPALGGASQTVVSDGALLNSDIFATTGIPEPWMRGGAVDSSGGSEIAFRSNAVASETEAPAQDFEPTPSSKEILLNLEVAGTIDAKNLTLNAGPTPVLGGASQTVVTGGTLDISQPVNGTFTVEKGGAITAGEQTLGEGNYEFSEDGTVASVASQYNEPAAAPANQVTESTNLQAPAMIAPAVTPIVSGSDSVIESPVASKSIEQPSVASVELPVLVETASNTHAEEPVAMDDIAFTDDDSFVPAPTESVAPDVADPHASAKDEVTAAVGGAFVAGTATQVAPTRGASIRKELPLKP